MEADAALRGLRLEVGRLVAQQQTRHGCDYCSDSRSLPWPPPTLRMRGATAPTPPLGRRGPAGCHVTGGRRALRLPPHFAALCGGGEGGGGAPPCPALLPSSLSGGVGDGDVRERAGGGQEEPERGAGREREAVSAAGWGGVRRGEARRGRSAVGASRRAGQGLRGRRWPGLGAAGPVYRVCAEASALAWPRAALRWWGEAVGLGTTLFVWCRHFPRSSLGTGPT